MPIYMDLHILPDINSIDVAKAHIQDVYLEKEHGCKCLTYWVDELHGQAFCLIDAPSKEKVYELHKRSHGLVPNKIILVQPDLVQSFLGRITDPKNGTYSDNGLLLIDDTSYRMIMVIRLPDTILMQQQLGAAAALQSLAEQNQLIRNEIAMNEGKEALQDVNRIIGSFITAEKAVTAAISIHEQLKGHAGEYRISVHAGEPVTQHDQLFGETLLFLSRMCFLNRNEKIGISSSVKELLATEMLHKGEEVVFTLSAYDETLLNSLFNALEEHYTNPDLQMLDIALWLTMSQSQLYRKITALTGYSPNDLLKEYRLAKAKEHLKKRGQNITGITFACGFNSPSYFTKCFKKKFGMLPLAYMERS